MKVTNQMIHKELRLFGMIARLFGGSASAEELGIRTDQLFIGGESGDGGLCAAVTLYARDKKEVQLAFQMPLFPMLDDRMITESMKNNDAPIWSEETNKCAWKLYLGELYLSDNVPKYAAPARETDYSHLPPAYSYIGTIDAFYDETLIYFRNLQNAGVRAVIDTYDGCFHGFDNLNTNISKQAVSKFKQEFAYAVKHYFAAQPE